MRAKRLTLSEQGLTLIELLTVIVILGIIAAIAVPAVGGLIEKARTQSFVSNSYAVKDAATYYLKDQVANDHDVGDQISYKLLVEEGFLDEIKDPDTGTLWTTTNGSYVKVEKEKVVSICLYGEKRKLCSRMENTKLIDGPAPISELNVELVTPK
ncbi:prepilin-type N-terminal cleavage/methylation domain-containing protein [Peribacillus sp. FSL H8-0477]|uniref:type II secretion system protein n=1 Tax=Peribacillus sp. FSL H8-0477 TaxID=2921388 RepID=UPI0030F8FBAE